MSGRSLLIPAHPSPPSPSPETFPVLMEKKRGRHKKLQTAVLAAGIVIILLASFHRYLSGDLLVTTTTIYNFHTQHQHYAIFEQHDDPGGSPLPSLPAAGTPPVAADGVLFPDWEVLVLLPPDDNPNPPSDRLSCLFRNGAASPANFSGVIPSSRCATYRCTLPPSLRHPRRFHLPRLVPSTSPSPPSRGHWGPSSTQGPSRGLLWWNSLVYESLITDDDVIVFAKGINNRNGPARPAKDLRCVFSVTGAAVEVRTAVTSSAQEVIRCHHPDDAQLGALLAASAGVGEVIRIFLEVGDGGPDAERGKVVPSLAGYRPRANPAEGRGLKRGRSLLCACTMVFNVAKFLREWVVYHSRVGVDRFILYDNGSEDELDRVVAGLQREGYDVTSLLWLWPKTQEAGFSHCAASSRDSCEWMMYLDVDEFAFSPRWSNSPRPNPDMLRSILPSPRPGESGAIAAGGRRRSLPVGQVSMDCHEFGPSNRTAHPANGVTQGYTCRRQGEQRHKSIVRLEAVHPSLHNVIHHFRLRQGYRGRSVSAGRAEGVVVNHYKYQAWPEFKAKFRRRASAYVVDWTQEANPASKDRTPGLGFAAVEPPGWAGRFCDKNDTGLRDLVRRWFGRGIDGSTGDYRMEWGPA